MYPLVSDLIKCGAKPPLQLCHADNPLHSPLLARIRVCISVHILAHIHCVVKPTAGWSKWAGRGGGRVLGRWEITCVNARAQGGLEHRMGKMSRRELAGVVGEEVGEIEFRVRE